jgi:CRP-like cAMP-binding protein
VIGVDSLISGAPRSADCVAGGEVKVVRIPAKEFLPKLQSATFEDNLKSEALKVALAQDFELKDISDYLTKFE